jgi:hypothetical protein
VEVLCWNSCSKRKKTEERKKIEETADLLADFLFEIVFVCKPG